MTRIARSHNIHILLLTAPSDLRDNSFSRLFWKTGAADNINSVRTLHNQYNNIVREVASNTDAILVDLDTAFKENPNLHLFNNPIKDPIHPNDRGHIVIANEILRVLAEHNIVPEYKSKYIQPVSNLRTLQHTPN